MARNRHPDSRVLPGVAMFAPIPDWGLVDVVPSDYALLQRAKALRAEMQQPQPEGEFKDATDIEEDSSPVDQSPQTQNDVQVRMAKVRANYPLAAVAVGCSRCHWSDKKPALLVVLFLGLTMVLVVIISTHSTTLALPSTKPPTESATGLSSKPFWMPLRQNAKKLNGTAMIVAIQRQLRIFPKTSNSKSGDGAQARRAQFSVPVSAVLVNKEAARRAAIAASKNVKATITTARIHLETAGRVTQGASKDVKAAVSKAGIQLEKVMTNPAFEQDMKVVATVLLTQFDRIGRLWMKMLKLFQKVLKNQVQLLSDNFEQ